MYLIILIFVSRGARCVGWGGGWGGAGFISVVVALKGVKRCGCFEDPCCTSRARCVGGGWGGIIINVVFALMVWHVVGCFEDPCSTSRARCVGVGWGRGVGRDNYKRCSCIEGCDTLWLF